MSIYGGKELAEAFRTVRKNTIQVAEDIPEDKYKHVAGEGCRSVARMLTHVAISTRIWEQIHKEGLTTLQGFDFFGMIDKFTAEEIKPRTKAEIVALLRSEDGKQSAIILAPRTVAGDVNKSERMVFHRYADRYFLAQIWMLRGDSGRELVPSSDERRLAKEHRATRAQKVEVAAR